MDPDSLLFYLILLLVLIGTNAFFAMSEIAVISLNENRVRKMAQEGDRRAKILIRLIDSPSKFLATIQVGVTLSGLLASAVAADTFTEYVVYFLRSAPFPPAVVRTVSLIVITLLLSFVTLVFGELVPKRVAMQNPEKVSFSIARILSFLYLAGRPLVALLSASTNGVLRLLRIDPEQKPEEVTEEGIRMMVDAGNENGSIEQSEREMIHNVFEFDDRIVEEIMTHRTEMFAIEQDTPLEEILAVAVREGYSRIPVYVDDIDNIVGILYIKDLLKVMLQKKEDSFRLVDCMRPAFFVPESNRCNELFGQFQSRRLQMAIVVDEYGGTAGLVTMEDLLESIVGNIQDEYDHEAEEISPMGENQYSIAGTATLDEVGRLLGLEFDDEEDDYDTLGGYIVGKLGHIPAAGDSPTVLVGSVEFTVTEVQEHRIERVRAVVHKAKPQAVSA